MKYRFVLAVLAMTALLVGAAPAQASPKGTVSVPNLVLRLSLPGGDVVRTATVTSRETGVAVKTSGVAANTCYLGGSLPSLLHTEDPFTEQVYFPASFRCDLDVVGTPELTAALQSGFMGSYTTEKIVGPYKGNPVALGVILDKDCVQISLGVWRGVAHPRVISDAVIYDWGWIPTYDQPLGC